MKYFISLLIVFGFFSFVLVAKAQLLSPEVDERLDRQSYTMAESAGFDTDTTDSTISEIVASVIKTFLGLLGIIFIVLIVWAGYEWMTAGGNDDKVNKARTTITRAVIGLVITLSAYAITYFVFSNIGAATGP